MENMVQISNRLILILGCFIYSVMESLAGRCPVLTVTLVHMLHDEKFPERQRDSCRHLTTSWHLSKC